jgi:hypothetical protein
MAYEIRNYDGTKLLDLPDGLTDDQNTSLKFVGKNVSNFGKIQNENILHLLQNFSGLTEPANKIKGQLWYDTSEYKLKFYNNGAWDALNVLDYSATKPQSGRPGYLWFDSVNKQLYANTGSGYSFVGPERVEGFGITRLVSTKITDNTYLENSHPVIKITINNEVIGIISTGSFTASGGEYVAGFTDIQRGINLKNQDGSFPIIGRTYFSNTSTFSINLKGGSAGSIPYQLNNTSTDFLSIGTSDSLLYSNGTTPVWKSLDKLAVANASTSTNLYGGVRGSLAYQTGVGLTSFINLGGDGYILTSDSSSLNRPKWVDPLTVGVSTAVIANGAKSLLNESSSTYLLASTSSIASTIVERDSSGDISAVNFKGSLKGNADSTSKLQTGRYISFTGAVTGSAKFDGTADISIDVQPLSAVPTGVITLWYGAILDVPTGWALCDGRNNTPDLRDRFVIGAGGNYDVRTAGGQTNFTIGLNHMPRHDHSINEAPHTHTFPGDDQLSFGTGVNGWSGTAVGHFGYDARSSSGGGNGTMWLTGGSKAGASTTNAEGLGEAFDILPPYYALAYIMKL